MSTYIFGETPKQETAAHSGKAAYFERPFQEKRQENLEYDKLMYYWSE